jgi:hypothetical protein
MSAPQTIDPDKLEATVEQVFGYLGGAVISAMIYLGDRLGLYRTLAAADAPLTSAELAATANLHERWVREWLRGQPPRTWSTIAARDASRSPEAVMVLADEESRVRRRRFLRAAPTDVGARSAAGVLPHRTRAPVRRLRARRESRRRAHVRTVVPDHAGAGRPARSRRRDRQARRGRGSRRRRLRRGRGALEMAKPTRARSSTATRSRSTRSSARR